MIKTLTISGNSLEGIGIFDGDKVVCKKAFSQKEIGNDTICIVYIPALGETVAKKIRFLGGHMVLKSCNNEVPDMKVKPDDVEIRGVVIELHRKPDELGRFDRGYESDYPF
jgi:SOS-response transcriptional repressor LexA